MGNGYNNHRRHHLINLHKSTFIPMLCSKTSIKDVSRAKCRDRSSLSNDPSSPKIGCMGQVKHHNKSITASKTNSISYLKLKKLFSSKNLITPTTTITSTTTSTGSSSCGSANQTVVIGCNSAINGDVCINIAELDPPLPVIKKVHKVEDCCDAENLWRRRKSSGVGLRSLQIQQIHTPKQIIQRASVR